MRFEEFRPEPVYYFSYGMLTDPHNMPDLEPVGAAQLPNFAFEMLAYANVVPTAGEHVDGVLWSIDRRTLSQLDRVEGYPSLYDRKTFPVFANGKRYEAWVYVMTPETRRRLKNSLPSRNYVRSIRHGYRAAGIDLSQLANSLSRFVKP
jgi:gamma-glutamylcyclotransferase (GGCT)/AIG2-like uncharacterized protein YtfP